MVLKHDKDSDAINVVLYTENIRALHTNIMWKICITNAHLNDPQKSTLHNHYICSKDITLIIIVTESQVVNQDLK